MTTPELPPLNRMPEGSGWVHDTVRERILQARIAELEADAERLDWLADQMRIADLHHILGATPLNPGDLRAAIDAARGAKP